jgi:hypothetical protein
MKSNLRPFREEGETSDHVSVGGPLMEPNNEVGGGDQISSPRHLSGCGYHMSLERGAGSRNKESGEQGLL